jgi:hypothetical protein
MTNPKSLTWTQVKKQIEPFSQAGLLDLIHQLYKVSDINKGFLTARFQPEATLGSKELETMKQRIRKYMCPSPSSYNDYFATPKYGPARKIITDYKKTQDTLGTLDLMLTYVEAGNEFTNAYGDIDGPFYDSLCSMLDTFEKLLKTDMENSLPYFKERLQLLAQSAKDIGWGYGDYVAGAVTSWGINY